MKILYLVHQFYPMHHTGTEKFLLNLSTMMQKWGHNVKVVTYSFYDESFYTERHGDLLAKEFTFNGIPILAFKSLKEGPEVNIVLQNPDLARFAEKVIADERPDVVHVAHPMRVGEFVKILIKQQIPYFITLTDFFLMCPKVILYTTKDTLCFGPQGGKACGEFCPELSTPSIASRILQGEEILSHAAAVISPSHYLASLFEKEFPRQEIRVISHGIDYSVIRRNNRLYVHNERLVFCYAGQLSFHKGVGVLIEAFKRLNEAHVFLKLYGSGTSEAVAKLRSMAKGNDRIEFSGVYAAAQVGEIYGGVDAVIIPSNWHENNPIVLNEAIACNVPLIVSDAGALRDRVQDGLNGYIFRMGDSVELAKILKKIVDNPNILSQFKRNSRKLLIPTIEQEAHSYLVEYDRLFDPILAKAGIA